MRAFACVFIIVGSLIVLGLMSMMGISYLEEGHGLHPAIAFGGVFIAGGFGTWAMGYLAELCGE